MSAKDYSPQQNRISPRHKIISKILKQSRGYFKGYTISRSGSTCLFRDASPPLPKSWLLFVTHTSHPFSTHSALTLVRSTLHEAYKYLIISPGPAGSPAQEVLLLQHHQNRAHFLLARLNVEPSIVPGTPTSLN